LNETTATASLKAHATESAHKGPHGVDAYIPFPFSETTQPLLQWLQMLLPIVGTVAAVVHACFFGFALGTIFFGFCVGFATAPGITVGFHRLFTHRSFETTRPIRGLLAVLGSMAGQDSLFMWVFRHREHHQFADRDGDPLTPASEGDSSFKRFLALVRIHLTWTLSNKFTRGDGRYIADLAADPMLCRIQRSYLLWVAVGYLIPAAACYAVTPTLQTAVGGLLWGCTRTLVAAQIGSLVNSVCHLWGGRTFDLPDKSRNNRAVALVTMGEGWHNNHHAFPTSARHGLGRGEIDLSWSIIKRLERRGLAWNVKTPSDEQIAAKKRGAEIAK
jgi:stearoyl-CoA desaturase (Delta-9 desaturase)